VVWAIGRSLMAAKRNPDTGVEKSKSTQDWIDSDSAMLGVWLIHHEM
jgi:hypothetical protein